MKSEQLNELASALAKAQSQIKSAQKDSTNPYFKSKYADLTSVWEACREALNKNGLSIVQTIEHKTEYNHTETLLVTTLLHTSGQWISGSCPLINQKNDMQDLGSACSYARRYGLSAIVGVTADDDDGESSLSRNSSGSELKHEQKQEPNHSDPGEYVCQVKKFKGKKLKDVIDGDIIQYIDWLKRNTDLSWPEQKAFIENAEAYLKTKYPGPFSNYSTEKAANEEIPY